MKEPFQRKSETPMPRRRVKKAGTRRGDAGAKKRRRRLPRVRGGKALARLNFFERQRQAGESDVAHKAIPAVAVVSADSTRSMGSRGTRGGAESPYLTAFAEKSHLARTAPAAPVEQAWRPIGPFSIPHGQTYGQGAGSRPPVAGRIVAVAIDPGNARPHPDRRRWRRRLGDERRRKNVAAENRRSTVALDRCGRLRSRQSTHRLRRDRGRGFSVSASASAFCVQPTAAPRGRSMRLLRSKGLGFMSWSSIR